MQIPFKMPGDEAIEAWATDYGDCFYQSCFVIVAEHEGNASSSGCKSVLEANAKPFDSFSDGDAPLKELDSSIQLSIPPKKGGLMLERVLRGLQSAAPRTVLLSMLVSTVPSRHLSLQRRLATRSACRLRQEKVFVAAVSCSLRAHGPTASQIDAEHALSASGQSSTSHSCS